MFLIVFHKKWGCDSAIRDRTWWLSMEGFSYFGVAAVCRSHLIAHSPEVGMVLLIIFRLALYYGVLDSLVRSSTQHKEKWGGATPRAAHPVAIRMTRDRVADPIWKYKEQDIIKW